MSYICCLLYRLNLVYDFVRYKICWTPASQIYLFVKTRIKTCLWRVFPNTESKVYTTSTNRLPMHRKIGKLRTMLCVDNSRFWPTCTKMMWFCIINAIICFMMGSSYPTLGVRHSALFTSLLLMFQHDRCYTRERTLQQESRHTHTESYQNTANESAPQIVWQTNDNRLSRKWEQQTNRKQGHQVFWDDWFPRPKNVSVKYQVMSVVPSIVVVYVVAFKQ